jgi:2-haloacid dehalogenase
MINTDHAGAKRRGAVIWDLGNVLIRWDPRHLYRHHFGADTAAMEWFLSNVCTPSWNEQLDAGLPFAKAVSDLGAIFPQFQPMIALYASHWREMLGDQIEANVSLLRQLKARGVSQYALTNWSAETFPIAQARFDFLSLFDGIVVSGIERLVKPDPAIYQVLLERYNLAPEHTYFIDDVLKNVLAARALQIKAVHFTPTTNLTIDMFMPTP